MKYSTPSLDINLDAVKHNYNLIKKYCKNSEVCGTVKASSYGLGGHNKIVNKLNLYGFTSIVVSKVFFHLVERKYCRN